MNHKIRLLTVSLLFLATIMTLGNAINTIAEPMYSWKDKTGRTFFGSKPASGAIEVQAVQADNISRYSSDKVLEAYRYSSESTSGTTAIEESTLPTPEAEKNTPVPVAVADPATLKRNEIKITLNNSGQVSQCHVLIENTSEIPATELRVSFSFPDGSIVPAFGPENIAAHAVEAFTIPDSLLPLQLGQSEAPVTEENIKAIIYSSAGEH
ncbi:MAG: hypothetical protein PHC51_12955 [bacterium]|nr:hypothetical protein [bacterium]